MQILVKCNIQKGEFHEKIQESEITQIVKEKMLDGLCSHISENSFKMLACDHSTSEIKMKSIFIEDADGFLDKVNILLGDPGMSKKDFREYLIELINKS